MQKGNISNQAAPSLLVDMNLLFKKKQGFWSNVRSCVGLQVFEELPYARETLNYAFRRGWSVHLVDRNKGSLVRPESLVEDWLYTSYTRMSSFLGLRRLIEEPDVKLAVFELDGKFRVSRSSAKAEVFKDWSEVRYILREV